MPMHVCGDTQLQPQQTRHLDERADTHSPNPCPQTGGKAALIALVRMFIDDAD
jgi:hypothetical protein